MNSFKAVMRTLARSSPYKREMYLVSPGVIHIQVLGKTLLEERVAVNDKALSEEQEQDSTIKVRCGIISVLRSRCSNTLQQIGMTTMSRA
jgi:hypothetical protein